MQALEHTVIEERLQRLAAEAPTAAIYCVDPYGAHFVDIPAAARKLFRWSLSADSPIELMETDHRVAGAELFVICRKTGSARGTVRLADAPDTEVDLHLLNGGDWVIGVAIDLPASDEPAVGVVHRNRVGRIVDVDEVTIRLLGRSRTQLLGARLDDFSHPDDVELAREGWAAIASVDEGVQQLRQRLRTDEGATVWVEQVDKNALHTELGVVITELTDVTETALVQQQETFQSALEERLDGDDTAVAYLRRDRTVEYTNARWTVLTGLAADAPFYEFVASVQEPEVVETAITRTFGYGKPADTTLTLRSHPRATERRIRMQTRVLEGPDGAPGVVVALDEIPQVRLSADGDSRMRRTDRSRTESDTPATAVATDATAGAPAPLDLDLAPRPDPPAPPPPPASVPTLGGRRASDPSAGGAVGTPDVLPRVDSAASDPASKVDNTPTPPKTAESAKATPAIGTGAPAVELAHGTDSDAEIAGTQTGDGPSGSVRSSRLAALFGLLVTAAIAAVTRLIRLESYPDWSPELEVWNSLATERIVAGDDTAVAAFNRLDQPTGGLNAFALGDWLSLETATELRWISAVVGVIGVVALYWAVRRWVGTFEAACAGVALALMVWHIHFSRLAVGEIFWPLLLTVAVGLLARPKSRLTWPIAGAALGGAVWFSHAAWLSLAAVFGVLVLWTLGGRRRSQRVDGPSVGASLGRVLSAAVPAALVALPVGLRLLNGDRDIRLYGGMDRNLSGDTFADWADTWGSLILAQDGNPFDASGVALPIGWVIGLLAIVGLILLFIRDRSLVTWIVVALAIVVPLGPALSSDGSVRHALGLAPFIALLAGIAAAWIARTIAAGSPRAGRLVGTLVIVLLVVLVGWSTYIEYFDSFPASSDLPVFVAP